MHRTHAPLGGDGDGFVCNHMGRTSRQAKCCLCDRFKHRLMIDNLMGIAGRLIRIDTAGKHDQWHLILQCVGHGVDPVQCAGADGANQNGRRVIAVVYTFGHEPRSVLVFGEDKLDTGLFQRINQGQHLAARHTKGISATGIIKTAGEGVSSADRIGHHRTFRMQNSAAYQCTAGAKVQSIDL